MATRKSSTKSDSPVAARAALDERDQPSGNPEAEAKAQEAQQRQELKEGQSGAAGRREVKARDDVYQDGSGDRASLRVPAGGGGKGAQGGLVDNMSRRHDGDALEGHFVTIDLNNKDARDAVIQGVTNGRDDVDYEPTQFNGGYGVYITPGERDQETGYPTTAVVRLRDASNARVTVPYESLSPSEAGHR
jgi:hypothetical protein